VNAAEVAHDGAADHDVVEVRDHEVGVVEVDVGAERREEEAGQTADREQPEERRGRRASASSKLIDPLYRVASS
jgi:hypothetical protein